MIIDEENIRVQYESTAESPIVAGDVLPFPYRFTEKEQLNAVLLDGTKLTYKQDYTVGETSITLSVDIPIGDTITIYRSTPLDQGSEFPQEAKFNSKKIEDALDKLTMQNQEQREALGRALKLPLTASTDLSDLALPNPDPNKSVKWNVDGTALVNTDFDPDLALALTENFKNQAQQAAVEAENQQNVATEQAQIATEQAQIATEQATQQAAIATQQAQIATEKAVEATSAVEEFAGITNVPYTMFESRYTEAPLYNISWLIANGTYNGSNAVHPSAYQALVVENNEEVAIGSTVTLPIGTEYTKRGLSVKLSTDSDITDYDFVVNTSDETFRLPLLDGSEDLVSDRYENLELLESGATYTAPANGWYHLYKTANPSSSSIADLYVTLTNRGNGLTAHSHGTGTFGLTVNVPVKKGDEVYVTYNATGATNYFRFIYAKGNGTLYFYVGETVQNANLINAGRIEEKVADLIPNNSSLIAGYCIPDYSAQIILDSGAGEKTYVAPSKGWFGYNFIMANNNTGYVKVNDIQVISNRPAGQNYYESVSGLIPIDSGDVIKYYTNVGDSAGQRLFNFYPMKGAN